MVLLGPSALDPSKTQRSGPKGYAHQWELEGVTPGCIAMAAVVVSSPPIPPPFHQTDCSCASTVSYFTRSCVHQEGCRLEDWLPRPIQTIQETHHQEHWFPTDEDTNDVLQRPAPQNIFARRSDPICMWAEQQRGWRLFLSCVPGEGCPKYVPKPTPLHSHHLWKTFKVRAWWSHQLCRSPTPHHPPSQHPFMAHQSSLSWTPTPQPPPQPSAPMLQPPLHL